MNQPMGQQSIFLVAATVVVSTGVAMAQDKPPTVTLPEANAPRSSACPPETTGQGLQFEDRWSALPPKVTLPITTAPLPETTGQAPTVSEKMGAEVESTKRDKLPVVTLPDAALDGGASLTGTTDQAATFEDRWAAQGGVTYVPPDTIAPETSGQGPNVSKSPEEN